MSTVLLLATLAILLGVDSHHSHCHNTSNHLSYPLSLTIPNPTPSSSGELIHVWPEAGQKLAKSDSHVM